MAMRNIRHGRLDCSDSAKRNEERADSSSRWEMKDAAALVVENVIHCQPIKSINVSQMTISQSHIIG
jgi:hypothetical protein